MRYLCPNHPKQIQVITYHNLQQGQGCSLCAKDKRIKRKTLSHEFVEDQFAKKGYVLLDTYKHSKKKLRYECPHHPDKELYITYNCLQHGQGCAYCANVATLEFSDVKLEFEKRGYQLLDTVYIHNKYPMKYICPQHPDKIRKISANSIRRGNGCSRCAYESFSKEKHYKWRGGVSQVNEYLREKINWWKLESLQKYNFKCDISKQNHNDLHIHHTTSFNKIRDDTFETLGLPIKSRIGDYTTEELALIEREFCTRHKEVLGVPLLKEIHYLFHSVYGKENNDLSQYIEFKQRFLHGEFK